MRTIHNYKLQTETWESQSKAGRYNPATEIVYRDKRGIHTYTTGAGTSDSINVFREGEETYILIVNDQLGYAALEIPGSIEVVFFQSTYSELREDFHELSPITQVKILLSYYS